MIKKELAKKAYKLSNKNSEEVFENSQKIETLSRRIDDIHMHSHSNKSILDQITASYLVEEKQKLLGIESGANKNVQADWQEEDSLKDSFIKNKPQIPTKTSDLTNDSGFITSSSLPTKVSDLTNDSGFITSSSLPTKTSELTNDSGFITSASLPTKVSELTNDSGFITNAADNLTNYYKKSETFTQAETNASFVQQTTTINGKALSSNISLDASDVGAEQTFAKNTAFNKNFETSTSNIKQNGTASVGILDSVARADHVHPSDSSKQDKITSSNKISADYVDDSTSSKTFVSSSDRATWNAKQNALSSSQLAAVNSGINQTSFLQIGTNTTNIAKKLDKSNSSNVVYVNDSSGNPTTLSMSTSGSAGAIARYNNSGVLYTSTPSANTDAANKQYVDNSVNAINMCPSSNIVTYSTTPTAGATLMTAPSNGVAYIRYCLRGAGSIGLHLQSSSGNDKAYNTQSWDANGYHLYCAIFVMKAGQKIYCYENAMTLEWGQINFVKSEE